MTYQQIGDSMDFRENVMIRILRLMTVDHTGCWRSSLWNQTLYKLASFVIGHDALDKVYYYGSLLNDEDRGCSLDELKTECENLKAAFN